MPQKTYEVTGPKFLGHPNGETFKAELDPAQEKRAIERGSIKVKAEKSADKEKE